MAEALGLEIAKICIEKPLSGAFKRAQFALNINSHLEELEKITKPTIEALLVGIDAGHLNDQARQIALEQLTCARHKLLDILDIREVGTLQKQSMSSSPMNKVLWFLSPSSNPIVCAFRDAPKVKAFIEHLDKVTRVHMSLVSMLRPPPSEAVSQRQALCIETGPHNSEEVIGREKDKDNIIKMLFESSQEKFSVVSIVGIGGMGKSTLAQFVYKDERMKKHFDIMFWFFVRQDLKVTEVVQSMVGSKTNENLAELQKSLLPLIYGKKFLLVLDNIWEDKGLHSNWSHLRQQLGFGGLGSKILVTTRSAEVAKTLDSIDPYMLGNLAPDDAWVLFQRVAFAKGQDPKPGLEDIGKKIVHKCSNFPLVIDVVGRHVRGKSSIREWEEFHDKLSNLSSCEPGQKALQTLKLTIDELGLSLKWCFAYFSLFPKGYLFDETRLICLWIALNFINATSENQSLVDVAKGYIRRFKEHGFLNTKSHMHDVIHDLAVSVAGSMYKMVDSESYEFDKKIQHVSFSEKAVLSENFPCLSLFEMKRQMHSILVLGNGSTDHELKLEGLSKFEYLRVLRLRGTWLEKVPRTIGKLIHLRYLDLSGNIFLKELPNSITQLVNLVYLSLRECDGVEELPRDLFKLQKLICLDLAGCGCLRKLPKDVSQLVNLRELCLDGCSELRHMPRGLENLSNLHKLDYFVAKGQSSSLADPNDPNDSDDNEVGKLADLNGLKNLEGDLEIVVDGILTSELEARAANLQGKRRLTTLRVEFKWGSKIENEMMLDGFQPHTNLRQLCIEGYGGQRLPRWIDAEAYSFSYLDTIRLENWKECRCIASIGRLPCLKNLYIERFRNLEYIENNDPLTPSTVPLFLSLESLDLISLPQLKGWQRCSNSEHLMLGANAFPCLKSIQLIEVGIKVLPDEFRGIPSLDRLNIFTCKNFTEMPEWIDTLTSLKDVSIFNCPKLTSLPKQISKLASLESLWLSTVVTNQSMIPRNPKLKRLSLSEMDFEIVPEEVRHISSLEFLEIKDWKQLKELPEWIDSLTNLEELCISGCPKMTSLPNQIANLINLKTLAIWTDCQEFKERYEKPSGVDCHLLQHVHQVHFEGRFLPPSSTCSSSSL